MSEQVTALDIWFSYSGKQQAFVESLVAALEDDSLCADAKAKAKAEIITKDLDHLGEFQLIPKLYARPDEDKESGKVYRLSPTENINKLVDEIASAFCKVLVITPDYFKSYVCLREMALTLSSFHIDKGFRPWLIWDESIEREVFSEKVERDFEIEEGSIVTTTLLKALQEVHKSLSSKPINSFASFDLSAERRQKFKEILLNFKDELYGNSSTPIPELAVLNYRYALTQVENLPKQQHQTVLKNLLKAWHRKYGTKLYHVLTDNEHLDCDALVRQLEEFDLVEDFLWDVKSRVDRTENSHLWAESKNCEGTMQFCIHILLAVVSKVDSAFASYYADIRSVLNTDLNEQNCSGIQKSISASVTFSVATGAPISINSEKASLSEDYFKTAISLWNMGIKSDSDTELISTLQAIQEQMFPLDSIIPIIDLHDVRKNTHLINKLRNRLSTFYRASDSKKYERMSAIPMPFIVLSSLVSQEGNIAFINKLNKFINFNFESCFMSDQQVLKFPCVAFASPTPEGGDNTYSVYFAERISAGVLPIIHGIHSALNRAVYNK